MTQVVIYLARKKECRPPFCIALDFHLVDDFLVSVYEGPSEHHLVSLSCNIASSCLCSFYRRNDANVLDHLELSYTGFDGAGNVNNGICFKEKSVHINKIT
ncbi:unnamed protein product [Ixodes pacificus]